MYVLEWAQNDLVVDAPKTQTNKVLASVYVCVMNVSRCLVSCPRRVLPAGAQFHGNIGEAVSPVTGSCHEAAAASLGAVPAADTEHRSGRPPDALLAPQSLSQRTVWKNGPLASRHVLTSVSLTPGRN